MCRRAARRSLLPNRTGRRKDADRLNRVFAGCLRKIRDQVRNRHLLSRHRFPLVSGSIAHSPDHRGGGRMSLLVQPIAMLKAQDDRLHCVRTLGRRAVLKVVDGPVRIAAGAGDDDAGEVRTFRVRAGLVHDHRFELTCSARCFRHHFLPVSGSVARLRDHRGAAE